MSNGWRNVLGAVVVTVGLAAPAGAAGRGDPRDPVGPAVATPTPDDLAKLTLEDLMNVEVTSVTKRTTRIADAPAAVTVITQEDIRRSGMSSIPELLRLVPGVHVGRINANKWAVAARGFNDAYSNKLLVLMDGRTVYTPAFSGVYWDMQDYLLPDLERIEVIRGPGATLWGSNAVNGVINITSKGAKETQGWLLTGRLGTEEQTAGVRYGGAVDDDTHYRAFVSARRTDDQLRADGDGANDHWASLHGGFRIDRTAGDDALTVQGEIFGARVNDTQLVLVPRPPFEFYRDNAFDTAEAFVLGRWTRTLSPTSEMSLQGYYDHFRREISRADYKLDTIDLDFQHRFAWGHGHTLTWGLGVRLTFDDVGNERTRILAPSRSTDSIVSAFVQDDVTLVPDRLHLFVGSKFEVNSYTGFEAQPNARLLWTPDERNSVWASVSRAVRTPSRWEQDGDHILAGAFSNGPGLPAGTYELVGTPDVGSETLIALEAGYRVRPAKNVRLDVAAFYNVYDNLISLDPDPPQLVLGPPLHFRVPAVVHNRMGGAAYGAEATATWQVTDAWRLSGSYSWLMVQLHFDGSRQTNLLDEREGYNPRHQAQVHSHLDVSKEVELNAHVYYTDELPKRPIPAFFRVDLGATWRPRENLSLTVGVQNLFDDRHPEFHGAHLEQRTETQRAAFVQVDWRL